jgi:hypothetical protein
MGSDAILCNCTPGFTGRRCEVPLPDPRDAAGRYDEHTDCVAFVWTQKGNVFMKMMCVAMCRLFCTVIVDTSIEDRKVNSSLCLTNYAQRHEDVWGNGGIASFLLTLRNGK